MRKIWLLSLIDTTLKIHQQNEISPSLIYCQYQYFYSDVLVNESYSCIKIIHMIDSRKTATETVENICIPSMKETITCIW